MLGRPLAWVRRPTLPVSEVISMSASIRHGTHLAIASRTWGEFVNQDKVKRLNSAGSLRQFSPIYSVLR